MALHKDFPHSPHAILDPGIRWFPADEVLRERSLCTSGVFHMVAIDEKGHPTPVKDTEQEVPRA